MSDLTGGALFAVWAIGIAYVLLLLTRIVCMFLPPLRGIEPQEAPVLDIALLNQGYTQLKWTGGILFAVVVWRFLGGSYDSTDIKIWGVCALYIMIESAMTYFGQIRKKKYYLENVEETEEEPE